MSHDPPPKEIPNIEIPLARPKFQKWQTVHIVHPPPIGQRNQSQSDESLVLSLSLSPSPSTQTPASNTSSSPTLPPTPTPTLKVLTTSLSPSSIYTIHSTTQTPPSNTTTYTISPVQRLLLAVPEENLIPAPFRVGDVVSRIDGPDAGVWGFEVVEVRVVRGDDGDGNKRKGKGKVRGSIMVKVRDAVGIEEWVGGERVVVIQRGEEGVDD